MSLRYSSVLGIIQLQKQWGTVSKNGHSQCPSAFPHRLSRGAKPLELNRYRTGARAQRAHDCGGSGRLPCGLD